MRNLTLLTICVALFSFWATEVRAQNADLELRVEPNKTLIQSQAIDVQSLITNDGRGPNLFRMFLRNQNTTSAAENLYFEVIVNSDRIGTIARATQRSSQPFSLGPGEQIYATNNTISNGLPGVEEQVILEGDLTPAGTDFVNSLQGSGSLPPDRYRVTVNIFQGSGQQLKVASATAEVGTNLTEDSQDFYLLSPGGAEGESIANPYPYFQWQGQATSRYRLLVVESKENDSPQSLLEGAESSAATQKNGVSAGGSLVDYEMLDVMIDQPGFQYPNTGAQQLEPGKTYYWRVIRQLNTTAGTETRESEIWNFTLAANQDRVTTSQGRQFSKALQSILGSRLQQLREDGYTFESVKVDDNVFRDGQAVQQLIELNRKAERGDVSILIENQ
ncbi:hypothetical protein LX73_1089 [Fodinibius salinus]|uniref:Uncharacterized protein n=1 Tax=Fodinibius salinus TaxID=860790 RepID=A0A5D3YKA0_9BACT|nr:hypothetical protein [Fodinibius salinus]TYP93386.1 hypothetical protein LX73_1089 [Fodinibius salinus]